MRISDKFWRFWDHLPWFLLGVMISLWFGRWQAANELDRKLTACHQQVEEAKRPTEEQTHLGDDGGKD